MNFGGAVSPSRQTREGRAMTVTEAPEPSDTMLDVTERPPEPGPGSVAVRRRLPRALTPFAIPAYRRLALALVLTTFASGVWVIGLVWEVIRIGGGPGELSVVTTASAIGVLLPALLGGVVADRIPQKLILLVVAAVELAGMAASRRCRSPTRPGSGTWRRCRSSPAPGWRSTTRPTRPGCPRSCRSPT